jgi:hypothetical protein
MEVVKRQENDIKYIIDYKGSQIYLCVENIFTGFKLEHTYNCQHTPLFGYDIDDLTMAENLLDEMIEKCKAKEEEKD